MRMWFLLLVMVAVYGFATIGDSSMLSAAMTQAVSLQTLGRALATRSVLGVSVGAIAPIAFGPHFSCLGCRLFCIGTWRHRCVDVRHLASASLEPLDFRFVEQHAHGAIVR